MASVTAVPASAPPSVTATSWPSAAGSSVPLTVTVPPNTTEAAERAALSVGATGSGDGDADDAATGSGDDPKAGAARASTQTAAATTSASAAILRLTRPVTTSRIDVLPP